MIEDLTHTAIQKKLQPPARWRNWWRAKTLTMVHCNVCCAPAIAFKAGQIIDLGCDHAQTYPSQEVAEIAAGKAPAFITECWDFVGAYREGERP